MEIYVRKDGQEYGPYTLDELRYHVLTGHCSASDLASHDGKDWMTVAQIPGLSVRDQPAGTEPRAQQDTDQPDPDQPAGTEPQNQQAPARQLVPQASVQQPAQQVPVQQPVRRQAQAGQRIGPKPNRPRQSGNRRRAVATAPKSKKIVSGREVTIIGGLATLLAVGGFFIWKLWDDKDEPSDTGDIAQTGVEAARLHPEGEATEQQRAEAAALEAMKEIERLKQEEEVAREARKLQLMQQELEEKERELAGIPDEDASENGPLTFGDVERLFYESSDLFRQGRYPEAKEKMARAYEAFESLEEKDPVARVRYLRMRCNIAFKLKENDQAIEFATELLALAGNDEDRLFAFSRLGLASAQKGQFDKAIENFEQELALSLKTRGPEHPSVTNTYNNLAACYNNQGNSLHNRGEYGKAIEYLEKSLDIKLKTLGPEHPDIAISHNNLAASHNNLGNTYLGRGEHDKGIEHFEKSLAIRLKTLGPDHLDLTGSYSNLAVAYHNKGDHKKAVENFEKSLVIKRKILGADHPDVKRTESNLANAKAAANR